MMEFSAMGRVQRIEHHSLLRQYEKLAAPGQMFDVLGDIRGEYRQFIGSLSADDLELRVPTASWMRRYMEAFGEEPDETLRAALVHAAVHLRERAAHLTEGREIVRWD
jgi:hypothetical protein